MLTRARVALGSPDSARRAIDFVIATLLFRVSPGIRRRLFSGTRHECPICGARLARFVVLHRPFFRWCPVCRSLQRHRLIWLLLQRRVLANHSPERVLHFAPEESLAEAFRRLPGVTYVTTDRYQTDIAVRADIVHIPHQDAVFDLVLCSHVLEHIPADQAAMRELRRVLRPGGVAIILTPVWNRPTYEDAAIIDPLERERHFGQHDHVRWYGLDIRERLASAEFAVDTAQTAHLATDAEIMRFGLDANDVIFVCTVRQE
jgi:hypothetical protein